MNRIVRETQDARNGYDEIYWVICGVLRGLPGCGAGIPQLTLSPIDQMSYVNAAARLSQT